MLKIVSFLLMGWLWTQSVAGQTPSHDFSLDQYRWKNRLLLVFFDTPEGKEAYQAQKQLFESKESELLERDLLIFDDQAVLKPYRQRFRLTHTQNDFSIVLVGKDGGQKAIYDGLTPLKRIFELIDQMPMRRAEMRKN
ncbi:MAG: DUF4174 domain-containing protein [Bacteroidota bacterium]